MSTPYGVLEGPALREQAQWRQVHTFGGYLWPTASKEQFTLDEDFDVPPEVLAREKARERRMSMVEVLDEVEWLLDAGVPVEQAARQLGRKVPALQRYALREGRNGLAGRLVVVSEWERMWRKAS